MDMIYTEPYDNFRGVVELGYLNNCTIDIEVGNSAASNDFEVRMSLNDYDQRLNIGSLIYDEQGSEYGGVVYGKMVNTEENEITLTCKLWRGMLNDHVIVPPNGEAYFIFSGDANDVLADFIDYDGLMIAKPSKSGIYISDKARYDTVLKAMERSLLKHGARIGIGYNKSIAECEAVQIRDLSNTVSFDNDYGIPMSAEFIKGYNHIIGLGRGELIERQKVELWRLKNGTVTADATHPDLPQGLSLRTYVYDYSSVESYEELQKETRKEFDELAETTTMEIEPSNIELEIGDIVSATERITGITMKQQITRKIVRGEICNGISFLETEYKVGD